MNLGKIKKIYLNQISKKKELFIKSLIIQDLSIFYNHAHSIILMNTQCLIQ